MSFADDVVTGGRLDDFVICGIDVSAVLEGLKSCIILTLNILIGMILSIARSPSLWK
jgi:hypothetical protein